MTDLTTLDAAELAGKIHSREVSSVEVTQAHLDRIAAVDTEYHAFLHVAGETGSRSQPQQWTTRSQAETNPLRHSPAFRSR